jgi:hypothetical protein
LSGPNQGANGCADARLQSDQRMGMLTNEVKHAIEK